MLTVFRSSPILLTVILYIETVFVCVLSYGHSMLNAPVLIQSLKLSSIGLGLSLDRLGILNALGLFACHTLPPVSAMSIAWLLVWQLSFHLFSVLTLASHFMLLHHIYFLCLLYNKFLHCLT